MRIYLTEGSLISASDRIVVDIGSRRPHLHTPVPHHGHLLLVFSLQAAKVGAHLEHLLDTFAQ